MGRFRVAVKNRRTPGCAAMGEHAEATPPHGQPTVDHGLGHARAVAGPHTARPLTAFSLVALGSVMLICGLWSAAFTETLDKAPGTQRNGMHSCPLGMFVSGVHVGKNQLLCTPGYATGGPEIVDGDNEKPTQCNGMHCCPQQTAVTGIHVGKNWLACAPFDPTKVEYGKLGWAPRVDKGETQRQGMHACPDARPLLGIHVGKNHFTCIGPGRE